MVGRLRLEASRAEHNYREWNAFDDILVRHAAAGPLLDVGCGKRYPMALLAERYRPTLGVDLDALVPYHSSFFTRFKQPSVKGFVRQTLIFPKYYRALKRVAGRDVSGPPWLARMNASCLGLATGAFGCVVSNAAFEHFPDVASALAEIARVLRPGGIAAIHIHLFPSLYGGHDGNHFWRHLWDSSWRDPVGLNRLAESDYLELAKQTNGLSLIEVNPWTWDGQDLLTEDLRRKIPSRYTDMDLTKNSIFMVLKRS